MDLIDRQKAIDAIKELTEWYRETCHEKRPTTIAVIDEPLELPAKETIDYGIKKLNDEVHEARLRLKIENMGLYEAVKEVIDDMLEQNRGFIYAHYGLMTEWCCDILKLIELAVR